MKQDAETQLKESSDRTRSAFPLTIEFASSGERLIVEKQEDLPRGKSFKIIKTS